MDNNDVCVHIHFGDICNMTCSYCINGHDHTTCMDNETLVAVIKFINTMPNVKRLRVIGGEPTVYPSMSTLMTGVNAATVELMTNGLRYDKLKEILDTGGAHGHMFDVSVTAHHDYWRTHKDEYVHALSEDYHMLREHSAVRRVLMCTLLDVENVDVTVDVVNWLLANVDFADTDFDCVRRACSVNEFVKTYTKFKKLLPSCVVESMFEAAKHMVVGNTFYGKPCKQFAHFFEIDYNGKVHSSLCKQARTTTECITSSSFTVSPYIVTCQQRDVSCIRACLYCNGLTI